MRTSKKTAIGFFMLLFILGISTTQAATPDWGVRGGDVIRWDATHYFNNPYLTYTLAWYVIATIDGFPEYNGMNYINGSINQNGTIIDDPVSISPISLKSLGSPAGSFIGDVLDDPHLNIVLIGDSLSLNSLKSGFEYLDTNFPDYSFTETVPNESYKFIGSGIQADVSWTYSAVINYTTDKVLYSMDEDYNSIYLETQDVVIEEFEWRRTSYEHGTGELPPTGPPASVPGFSLSVLLGTLIIGIAVLLRKHRLN